MIRRPADRDVVAQPTGPTGWLLINQVDHARVSAEIAACLPAQNPMDALVVQVIHHHDDGWRASDDELVFDDAAGRPFDFREMPSQAKNQIWGLSIEQAARFGPLGQYLVASHFLRLRGTIDSQDGPQSHQEFAHRYQGQADRWLAAWKSLNKANTRQEALYQLQKLRWLDDCSLWLCCSERQRPWQTVDHEGRTVCFTPEALPRVSRVEPWPFPVDRIECQVPARFLPENRYPDAEAMRAAMIHDVSLRWSLLPS